MPDSLAVVITTIQQPTKCCVELAQRLAPLQASFIVIGDSKGPASFDLPSDLPKAKLFKLDDQLKLPYQLAKLLPTKHYARKNLGYLVAIADGATCLYETDDDNAPLPGDGWKPRALHTPAQKVQPRKWMNVYRLFTDGLIWPRGFPLQLIRDPAEVTWDKPESIRIAVSPKKVVRRVQRVIDAPVVAVIVILCQRISREVVQISRTIRQRKQIHQPRDRRVDSPRRDLVVRKRQPCRRIVNRRIRRQSQRSRRLRAEIPDPFVG